MEIPSLVRSRLDDEEIETAVSLGDEDVVCFTQSRTLLYRGEGLLSDEGVEVFSHDVERLSVSEGRRKTKFVLEYVDGTESFTVPSDRGEAVLERLVDGVLTTAGVVEPDESLAGVFRFSELSLVVTDARLVKHVGTPVWDSDYEEFPFEEVTGLSFEEGSVATQVVLSVGGRSERIKAPNDRAPKVRETLTEALLAYHDVGSLDALNEQLGGEERDRGSAEDDIGLSEGISPLVGEGSESDTDDEPGPASDPGESREPAGAAGGADETGGARAESADTAPAETEPESRDAGAGERPTGTETASETRETGPGGGTAGSGGAVGAEEFRELKEQVDLLTRAVKRQNEILEQQRETVQKQQEAVEQQNETVQRLIEELRQGR